VLGWLGVAACTRSSREPPRASVEQEVEAALRAEAAVAALRKLPGAHWHAAATFRIVPAGQAEADAGSPGDAITTTTDLWLDKQGNFRLVESNDRDNGREVVRVGNELAVGMRYGKLMRRPAQDPEPARFLEEALGAPWAAWEIVRRFVQLEPGVGGTLRLGKRPEPLAVAPAAVASRRWRDTVEVQVLEGDVQLHAQGALQSFSLRALFTARRDGTPLDGELRVTGRLEAIGATAEIAMPETAETLPERQRTVLDERALLGGLGAAQTSGRGSP
jgi:hypothetical protein